MEPRSDNNRLPCVCVNPRVKITQATIETTSVRDTCRAFLKVFTAMLRNRKERKHEVGFVLSDTNKIHYCTCFPIQVHSVTDIRHAPTTSLTEALEEA